MIFFLYNSMTCELAQSLTVQPCTGYVQLYTDSVHLCTASVQHLPGMHLGVVHRLLDIKIKADCLKNEQKQRGNQRLSRYIPVEFKVPERKCPGLYRLVVP